jgi:hypothetical protein
MRAQVSLVFIIYGNCFARLSETRPRASQNRAQPDRALTDVYGVLVSGNAVSTQIDINPISLCNYKTVKILTRGAFQKDKRHCSAPLKTLLKPA